MPFNNIIGRGDVVTGEETIDSIMADLDNTSAARTLFRQISVGKNQQRFPVLSALPLAYWVNGDTGLKQTTEMAWTNKFVNIEELAVIVPVPQNVLDDADYDIWGEARPLVRDAIDRALDQAIFFGDGAPASFPDDILASATAAGNAVTANSTTAQGGFFGDIDNLYGAVEDDGFNVSGIVASKGIRSRFRRARNAQGDRLDRDRINGALDEVDGTPISYAMEGLWPVAATTGQKSTLAFAGDFGRQFVLALRKDVTYEVFREGVIQDQSGAIVYNLLQQDMVALRVTFRAGWQVANTINYAKQDAAQRYPAAVLQTAALA